MALSPAETIQRIYERWGRGDYSGAAEIYDPHAVLVMAAGFPDTGVHVGLDGIRAYMRGFLEPWERITIRATEVIEAGDSVVVQIDQHGVGEGSGAATDFRYFHVWTFRGGRAIRLETFRERRDALAAVGLDESGAET